MWERISASEGVHAFTRDSRNRVTTTHHTPHAHTHDPTTTHTAPPTPAPLPVASHPTPRHRRHPPTRPATASTDPASTASTASPRQPVNPFTTSRGQRGEVVSHASRRYHGTATRQATAARGHTAHRGPAEQCAHVTGCGLRVARHAERGHEATQPPRTPPHPARSRAARNTRRAPARHSAPTAVLAARQEWQCGRRTGRSRHPKFHSPDSDRGTGESIGTIIKGVRRGGRRGAR